MAATPGDQPTSETDEVKTMSIKEFLDEGYLQEVNRRFFHPLGLALEVQINGGEYSLGNVWDYREDDEGMIFGPGVLSPGKAANIDKITEERIEKRKAILGYTVQPTTP